mgnify:CR=1 FL=1
MKSAFDSAPKAPLDSLKIKIIHEPNVEEPFAVVFKPSGLASAPLKAGESSALTQTASMFPAVLNVDGKKSVEAGLVHRIDTATSGLLLVASSQEFYNHILACQQSGRFIKGYSALCDIEMTNAQKLGGFPELPERAKKSAGIALNYFFNQDGNSRNEWRGLELSSYFRYYQKGAVQVRPVLENSNSAALKKIAAKKLYSTRILSIKADAASSVAQVKCKIAQGFKHQVRSHLAWLGLPARGDSLYNFYFAKRGVFEPMRFYAVSLEFPDLNSNKVFNFEIDQKHLAEQSSSAGDALNF